MQRRILLWLHRKNLEGARDMIVESTWKWTDKPFEFLAATREIRKRQAINPDNYGFIGIMDKRRNPLCN